jgi:hypothetical protein
MGIKSIGKGIKKVSKSLGSLLRDDHNPAWRQARAQPSGLVTVAPHVHESRPAVHVSQPLLRPQPLFTQSLINPLLVVRVQWRLGVSLIVDRATTVRAAVVGLMEFH